MEPSGSLKATRTACPACRGDAAAAAAAAAVAADEDDDDDGGGGAAAAAEGVGGAFCSLASRSALS